MSNTQPSYSPSDPNYLSNLLTHLSSVSDPNYQANAKAYNQMTGLDVNGRYQGYNAARYMIPAVYQQLAGQLGYYNSLQPMAQQGTNALLAQLSNPDQMARQYRNQANASGQSTLQSVLQRLRSGGAGIGATQGAQVDMANRANAAGNAYQAQLDSPEGRAQRLNSMLALISGQNPNLSNLSTLHQMEVGTPRNQTFGDILQGLAQSAAGGFSSSATGRPQMAWGGSYSDPTNDPLLNGSMGMPGSSVGPGGYYTYPG